ncbi:cation diffusion facilitator family transporter [Micromonospora avicenniae]|uniref:Cation diffusion facilitator family transporter n=1 Tax=Micromonospora avicenniae TaxID=1198245 RepID=A0A1N6ZVK2_9ACTN|nr:cation diffusion facilitator family transporter [Micromonospora avicenniae]SIR30843.1 cation diffusion facilitator family transporter [Micromonospora avicenniae]
MSESPEAGGNLRTVILAGAVNLGVAVTKGLVGFVTGSAALLAEAMHSLADTSTEVLLFVGLRRGARPPTEERPFGHDRETYIWALLAAVATFLIGGGLSIEEGVEAIRSPERPQQPLLAYLVILVAAVLESISLARSVRQIQARARRFVVPPLLLVRYGSDTPTRAVFFEDAAALVGLALAGAGVALTDATGNPLWDGLASIAIGLLLICVAAVLGYSNLTLLIGRGVPERGRARIKHELLAVPAVEQVQQLLTLYLGPNTILVAAKIDFVSTASSTDVEVAADEAERRLIALFPTIRYVFLDPTGGGGSEATPRSRPDPTEPADG